MSCYDILEPFIYLNVVLLVDQLWTFKEDSYIKFLENYLFFTVEEFGIAVVIVDAHVMVIL